MSKKVYVTKDFEFESAHYLPNHSGHCRNMHGHSYKMSVTVSREINFAKESDNPSSFMVMDFTDLKNIVNDEVVCEYDHSVLNHFFKMPTAENMAVRVFEVLRSKIDIYPSLRVESVKIWETSSSYAEYRGEET